MVKASARPQQLDFDGIFEAQSARTLLDQLFIDSKLYTKSADFKELLDFVVRLRNFAPFNAMLLQLQKRGLRFAASELDWWDRFERRPTEGARPLIILWPFGPVALVYDVVDTVGKPLPSDVASFFAHGAIDGEALNSFRHRMLSKGIECRMIDGGDGMAGSIRVIERAPTPKRYTHYRMLLNQNHAAPVQFVTIAHELAHLFLGHLGADSKLHIPDRPCLTEQQVELEAESVAYIVSARNGIESKSQIYLTNYVEENTTVADLDIYQLMRATGQVETLLGLGRKSRFSSAGIVS